jgi:hypothetical protein
VNLTKDKSVISILLRAHGRWGALDRVRAYLRWGEEKCCLEPIVLFTSSIFGATGVATEPLIV